MSIYNWVRAKHGLPPVSDGPVKKQKGEDDGESQKKTGGVDSQGDENGIDGSDSETVE